MIRDSSRIVKGEIKGRHKVKVKEYSGDLVDNMINGCIDVNKEYDVVWLTETYAIINLGEVSWYKEEGDNYMFAHFDNCPNLDGGKWELITFDKVSDKLEKEVLLND